MASTSVSGTASAAPTAASGILRANMRKLASTAVAGAVLLTVLPGAVGTSELAVDVSHMRSAKGMVRVCLTADPDNFPACVDDAKALTRTLPAAVRTTSFPGLPQRGYALAIIHDENSNSKLDTIAGIPREGYGFSNNAAVRFGPPRFSAARFMLAGDAEMQQVRMRYIF